MSQPPNRIFFDLTTHQADRNESNVGGMQSLMPLSAATVCAGEMRHSTFFTSFTIVIREIGVEYFAASTAGDVNCACQYFVFAVPWTTALS